MTRKVKLIMAAMLPLMASTLSGCLKSDHEDYEIWRAENDAYLKTINMNEFEKVSPDWAPLNSVYIKWHNDRSLTAGNLVPMANSTVVAKYELEDINGTKIENSYARRDSAYTSQPLNNVIGMWIALTTMHVGDSATLIIPYDSGYGAQIRSGMKPYTNLIYHLKLKEIKAFERPAD